MDILIKNMKMPSDCSVCKMNYDRWCCKLLINEESYFFVHEGFDPTRNRLPKCPLVEVPPHGRLIDADKLRASFKESIEECRVWANEIDNDTMMYARVSQSLGTFVEASLRVKAAPTVIESEE